MYSRGPCWTAVMVPTLATSCTPNSTNQKTLNKTGTANPCQRDTPTAISLYNSVTYTNNRDVNTKRMRLKPFTAIVTPLCLPLSALSLYMLSWPVCTAQRGWRQGKQQPLPPWLSWKWRREWGASPEGQKPLAPEEGASVPRTSTPAECAWGTHKECWL